jgi:F-type H+-transporting ATPase subunit b
MTSSAREADSSAIKRSGSGVRRPPVFAAATIGLTVTTLSMLCAVPAVAADKLELIPDYALFGLILDKPGFGSLWIMLIGFVVLIFPLNMLIFQPIFRTLDARAERINGARDRSVRLDHDADDVLERYESAIRQARAESEATRQGQLATAREEQAVLTSEARGESERELDQARARLNASLDEARAKLRADAEDLAKTAAEQVLGRALS